MPPPLVDYSSDSEPEPAEAATPNRGPTKPTSAAAPGDCKGDPQPIRDGDAEQKVQPPADLPPLPAAFHDLYASTVRTSTADDPSLHQGRTRQTPHIAGQWPSHIYIECAPA